MSDDYEHWSLCPNPDHVGGCSLEQQLTDDLDIVLVGVPCDVSELYLEVRGQVRDTADLKALIEALQEFAGPLAEAEAEASCSAHNHDDEDPEDDDELRHCDGCGSTAWESCWLVPSAGYLGDTCGCLAAAGFRPSEDGRGLERI